MLLGSYWWSKIIHKDNIIQRYLDIRVQLFLELSLIIIGLVFQWKTFLYKITVYNLICLHTMKNLIKHDSIIADMLIIAFYYVTSWIIYLFSSNDLQWNVTLICTFYYRANISVFEAYFIVSSFTFKTDVLTNGCVKETWQQAFSTLDFWNYM